MSDLASGYAAATHELTWVVGPDAVAFLDGQISQDVASMHRGEVKRSFLLEPRGKLQALLWVLRDDERVGMITWAGAGEALRSGLERFRFRVDAELVGDDRSVHSVWGPTEGARGWSEEDGALTLRLAGTSPSLVIAGIAPDPALTELTPDEIALHRIRSGEPIMGRDVDDSTIPQETGLVQEAVSFTKGCFLGQELVARIDSRGRVNRHLRRISLPDHVVPSGATVVADGVEVGTVGSVAATTDGSEALALLRREVEPGASVLVAGHMGTVDAVGGD